MHGGSTRTTLALDDDLMRVAQEYTGVAEKTALIREALKSLIERESARRLAALGGSRAGDERHSTSQGLGRMILADTSIWVDHFRLGDDELPSTAHKPAHCDASVHRLGTGPGSLPQRAATLAFLAQLPSVRVARLDEVLQMVEARSLYSRGIGLIDAHLIASVFINPSTQLWTRDKRLRSVGEALDIHANLP